MAHSLRVFRTLFALSLLMTATSSLRAQKYLMGLGEYQCFLLDSARHAYAITGGYPYAGTGRSGKVGRAMPMAFIPDLTFRSICGGLHGGCAVDTLGHVWCWGDGSEGQIGDGDIHRINNWLYYPVKVITDSMGRPFDHVKEVVSYFSGNYAQGYYAIKQDGSLWVWGATTCGMRGDGTYGDSTRSPVQLKLPGGRAVRQLVAGDIAIILATDGTVWTCGGNGNNQQNLGYAMTGNQYLSFRQLTGLKHIRQVAGGLAFNYALAEDGTLYGWGYYGTYMGGAPLNGNTMGPGGHYTLPVVLHDITGHLPAPISQIVVNSVCTHVILTDGSMWGWGDNAMGTIGNGVELDFMKAAHPYSWDFKAGDLLQRFPVQITDRHDFVRVFGSSTFTFYTYAETADGTLYSWGRNKGAVLGNGIMGCSGDIAAKYPNSWDVPKAAVVNPLTLQDIRIQPGAYCQLHPDESPCNQCKPR